MVLASLLPLLLPFLVAGDGEPFDIELYPPGLDTAHHLLSKEELLHVFGVPEAHMVDHTRYQSLAILNPPVIPSPRWRMCCMKQRPWPSVQERKRLMLHTSSMSSETPTT